MSRLDRFLVADSIINKWGVVGQRICSRDISDHCPIWLVKDNEDWGPKSFKINNEWFAFKSFIPFVEKSWKEIAIEGRSDFVLKEKFRILKERLRWWNREIFERIDLEVEEEVTEMNKRDSLLEVVDEGDLINIIKGRKEASSRFWLNLRIKENMLIQKSRLTWLNEGDSNSGFFHKAMKERRRHNHIGPITSSRGLLESVNEVKEEVFSHFACKFEETDRNRPSLEGIPFRSISMEERSFLEAPFEESEIKEAAVVSSFLSLIPKSSSPLSLDDYRPICLIGCMYKALSKLLAGRLKGVLNSIISSNQSAFVPGRHLLAGVLIATEVVDYAHKEGRSCFLFKVDFGKAYDKVNWNFLRFLLKEMGFGETWMRWMELLVFQSRMSVLVNGSPTKEFTVERGLRQGDPLSPFLFVIVAEGLTALVKKAIAIGDYEGFNINGKCEVDVLQFADDTLLIGEGNWKQVWAIKTILKAFELVSGLGINYHKSKLIGINVTNNLLEAASSLLACKVEGKVFSFLGIRVGSNPRRISTWNPLLEKLKKRLLSWKNRFLNFGGRITLIKSILCSLSIFTMSFFRMPVVIRYGDICLQITIGGDFVPNSSSQSIWWKDILSLGKEPSKDAIINNCKFKGNFGITDSVAGSSAPLDVSSLFAIPPTLPDAAANSLLSGAVSATILQQLKVHTAAASCSQSGQDSVVWELGNDAGFSVKSCYNFYAGFWHPFGPNNLHDEALKLVWRMQVPFKTKAFGWRLLINKLPTKDLLKIRGMIFLDDSVKCAFCNSAHETLEHLFFKCYVVKLIWRDIAEWIGMSDVTEEDPMGSFMLWYNFCKNMKMKEGRLSCIWLAITWSIWIVRNSIIFRKDSWSVLNTIWFIKALVWRWSFMGEITHPNCNFYDFCKEPLFFLS
ncbi:uncharacterized protein LOC131598556 [Vicia villosa]|uniref:uncharacterized protein LOC131598556 n=1 Tax=Vicia villosa TaxID=3911 RepID=UPI00273CB9E1|nr:uncharacterized protein LOC131598556 [Vicia villosa]